MNKKTQNLLLYIAEALVEELKVDPDSTPETQKQVVDLGRRVEAMGRYVQSQGTGPGYMKMTKAEFLSMIEKDEFYDSYVNKADEIEAEGGFLPE